MPKQKMPLQAAAQPMILATTRRFVSERVASLASGLAIRTMQKHRQTGAGFPYYKVGRQVLYDLDEIEAIIAASRVGTKDEPGTGRAE